MKNLYPPIRFIYSFPYDKLLTEREGRIPNKKQVKEVKNYIRKFQREWNRNSDSIFKTLKELTKNEWNEKEIRCYVVKHCKYSGISQPLTIRMEEDFDSAFDTLIHELAHIIVSSDMKKYRNVEKKLKEQFSREKQIIILHIYINFLELQVLKKIFTEKIINKIIKRNLRLKGIKKAWEIVLTKEKNLKKLFY